MTMVQTKDIVDMKCDTSGEFKSLHRAIVDANTPFFKAAFESKMTEEASQTMRFEDVEVKTFGPLVHYLYFQELDLKSFEAEHKFTDGHDQVDKYDHDLLVLAKFWN
ncbi:uncharacterized protein RAG0_08980 [Rhynchosporium agropyri]|uniref:BTB domain-containing protein n=1 Tax=Rhynchosporium agropyri TaxID=914238 RepID=A0A1E1KT87_9HELO|nr:uncharacterized protein RAG0_08980 [Rhynchosporium agropyri]